MLQRIISFILSSLIQKKVTNISTNEVEDTTIIVEDNTTSDIVTKPSNGLKIVIDPGHGGKNNRPDPGAVGSFNGNPIYERDVVLNVGLELALILEAEGFEVIMTRIDNKTLSHLKDKCDIVKKEKPNLFVSIHANANEGKPGQGIECFFNASRPESIKLTKSIQDSLMSSFPDHKNRGIKDGSTLYVLKNHPVQACCLVECEFINHPEQVQFLLNNSKELAQAIAKGIRQYLSL